MKLELGAGHRPTPGYEHNDAYPFAHIEHVGDPWMLELPDGSVEEVLALAFVEHLTHDHALDTFRNVWRMLQPDGLFLFDVPDYPVWCDYYLKQLAAEHQNRPYTNIPRLDHIRKTLFGWQRWPGDEHLYGWDRYLLRDALLDTGFTAVDWSLDLFLERGIYRRRFYDPVDAHLYVCALK